MSDTGTNGTADVMNHGVVIVLSFSKPGIRKKVAKSQISERGESAGATLAEDCAIQVEADKDMLGVSKLIIQSKEYAKIGKHDAETASKVRDEWCLPGPLKKAGIHLLPENLVVKCIDYLKKRSTERQDLINAFLQVYPESREEAKTKLGELYDENDYPSVAQLEAAFSMGWQLLETHASTKLQAIKQEIFEEEKAKQEMQWQAVGEECRAALREGFGKLVSHMVDRLKDPEKKFKDTLVTNFRDFLETFSDRNITNDLELKALAEKAGKLLDGVDPQTLREEFDTRSKIAIAFENMDEQLGGMLVKRAKRQITIEPQPVSA